MANFAKKTKCTYSRYADDLTFSTNRKEFPEKIASQNNGNEWATSRTLKKEIEKVGFKVNEKKTSLQYKTSRQIATGLVVNKKVNIKKEYYRQTRSMCHSLFQSNEFFLGNTYSAKPAISENAKINSTSPATNSKTPLPKNPQGKIKQLESILSYIYSVKRRHDRDNAGKRKNYPNAITKLYRKFLFYKHFFSLNCPLIICEGKTDIVYLKCALRQLANEYGEFIEKTGPSFILKIDFLNLTKNLKDVLAISEGTGGLGSLMGIYEIYMKPFKGEGKKHPVIILIDNDSGSKEIIEIMKRKKKWDPSKPFAFFTENLYVVHISSESGTSEMAIEDLFDDQTQNTTVDGKKFNRKPKIDSASEYGKIVFAEKVIRANENSINFDGFKKVLNSFKAATQDYNKRITV